MSIDTVHLLHVDLRLAEHVCFLSWQVQLIARNQLVEIPSPGFLGNNYINTTYLYTRCFPMYMMILI